MGYCFGGDASLGMMTFESCTVSHDGNVISCKTRQEKYQGSKLMEEYSDGGEFRLEKHSETVYDEDTDEYSEVTRWTVSRYGYPYSK